MLAESWGFTVVLGIALVVYLIGLGALLTLRGVAQRVAVRVAGMNRRAGCGQYVLFEVQHVGAGSPCPRLK